MVDFTSPVPAVPVKSPLLSILGLVGGVPGFLTGPVPVLGLILSIAGLIVSILKFLLQR